MKNQFNQNSTLVRSVRQQFRATGEFCKPEVDYETLIYNNRLNKVHFFRMKLSIVKSCTVTPQ